MNVSLLDARRGRSIQGVVGCFVVGHGTNMAQGADCERDMCDEGSATEWERGELMSSSFNYV